MEANIDQLEDLALLTIHDASMVKTLPMKHHYLTSTHDSKVDLEVFGYEMVAEEGS